MGEDLALALALEGKTSARGETAGLVALAGTLAALPEPEIDAAFADNLEQLLLTDGLPVGRPQLTVVRPAEKTSEQTEPRAPVVRMPRRRLMVRRSVAGIAAAASIAAFPVVAAASSLPGSPFYGLKQRIHAAQIAIFGTPVEDGFRLMGQANEHVREADQLAGQPTPDQGLIATTLEMASSKLHRAQTLILGNTTDSADLQKLAAMAAETAGDIRALPGLNAEARSALQGALDATASIQRAVDRALGISLPITFGPAVMAPVADATIATEADGTQSQASQPAPSGDELDKDELDKDDRTGKDIDRPKEEGCRRVGEANMNGEIIKPIYDPLCAKPGADL